MNELLLVVTSGLGAIISGFAAWFFTRKKQLAETVSAEIDNDVKLSAHYKEILDDLKSRYELRYKEFEEMMLRKVNMLEEELRLKDRKIKLQQQEINSLKREIKERDKRIAELLTI